jgi:hypothetical protein
MRMIAPDEALDAPTAPLRFQSMDAPPLALITGTPAGETLNGTGSDDTMSGLAGADTINGGAGNDTLYGYAANAPGDIIATPLVTGLSQPVAGASTDADPGLLYIVEKGTGVIWRVNADTGARTTFLDIPQDQFISNGERGVLGLAFHPDYDTNGRFFVFLTDPQGDLQVREYARSSNPAVALTTFSNVIEVPKQTGESNHNGGWIGFSPEDGFLYIATGDGGGGGDPNNYAQNRDVLLGKILRIDVNGDDFGGDATRNYAIPDDNPFANAAGADEVFIHGVRNPWRNAFDPRNGDFYIADVGQEQREEINYLPAGVSANLGWRIMEGTLAYNPGPPGTPQPGDPSLTLPIFEYSHALGNSLTGGEIYVGDVESFVGQYVFMDFGSNRFFSLSVVDGAAVTPVQRTNQITGATLSSVVDFATDDEGRLYAIGIGGTVWRLTPTHGAEDVADTLNGEGGNDSLDGGAGADRLFGGAGDDLVVWDPNDDLSNVHGGADTDALVFLRGTAPTTFNLVSHGFEGAQGRTTDPGGNPWATQTDYYDTQWRVDASLVVNDDATSVRIDFDQAAAFDWTTNWFHFDSAARNDINVLTYDNGTRAEIFYDAADLDVWDSSWNHYQANGGRDINTLTNDDGSSVVLFFDPDDAQPWSANWNRYNTAGQRDANALTNDDGSSIVLYFDPSNSVNWVSNWNQYNTASQLMANAIDYDDGSSVVLYYDPTDVQSWESNWNQHDSQDRLELNVLENDDGTRIVLDIDASDQFAWHSMWSRYDAGGNLIAFQGVNDDGSTF